MKAYIYYYELLNLLMKHYNFLFSFRRIDNKTMVIMFEPILTAPQMVITVEIESINKNVISLKYDYRFLQSFLIG